MRSYATGPDHYPEPTALANARGFVAISALLSRCCNGDPVARSFLPNRTPTLPPPSELHRSTRTEELRSFLFFTVVMAPLLAVVGVGGFGFLVWMYQLIAGPPAA